mgnify:CR=1 FL=1
MATAGKKRKKRSPKIKRTDPKQSARFIAAARELGLEESSEDFSRAIDALTKPKSNRGN